MNKQNKNLLHVVTNLSDGGLEKVVYLIIKNLKSNKFIHHIAVLTQHDSKFLEDKLKLLGVNIVYYNFDNSGINLRSLFKNMKELWKLSMYIKKKRINIVHSHDFFPSFIARLSCILSFFMFHKVNRIIVTLHNIFFWLSAAHHFINRVLSIVTYRVVCVSEAVRNYSIRYDNIQLNKYLVIFNGVETELFLPDPDCITLYKKEFDISDSNFVIGNIGVISVRKGQKYLIEAVKRLKVKYPFIKVLIFGGIRIHEKKIYDEIVELIKNNGLENIIKIFEPRYDINKIYNIFDLYVMPSISEGQSLSAIEAMLNERICLFSNIKPFAEMVDHGINAFLFKSTNAESLTEQMDNIISNYSSLRSIGKTARRIALKKYDIKTMIKSYELLYEFP